MLSYNHAGCYNVCLQVGYCQGLPFCVGMLLMHVEEEEAFSLLRFLMFRVGLRRQFHPDMAGLQVTTYSNTNICHVISTVQVSLYCMTRLLAETHPALYRHLDTLEADPSL